MERSAISLRFVYVSAPPSASSTVRAQAKDDQPAEVQRLEPSVGANPEQAGDIVLEEAATLQRAGNHDRAIELLGPLTSSGGQDAEHARVALADVLFELGRDVEADAELDALRDSRPSSVGACVLAGELLEDRGQTERALLWFNIALSRIDERELAQLTTSFGWLTYATTAIHGRRRARAALGMPEDEWDRAAPATPASGSPFPTAVELLNSLNDDDLIPAVRTLFWPTGELAAAATSWPDQTSGTDLSTYHRQLESRLRTFSERGAPRITLVPASVSGMQQFADRVGAEATDPTTRHAYMNSQVAQGQSIAWPPARNTGCWCGSGAKYKKCCRAPNPT
jgi:SEC-C motif